MTGRRGIRHGRLGTGAGILTASLGRAGHRAGAVLAAAICCLMLTGLIVLATPRPVTSIAIAVDYRPDLLRLERAAPYQVLAPAGLPVGWQAVNSRLTVVSGGPVSWHLGFVTPSGQIASVEESDEYAASFIRRMTNSGFPVPPARAGGTWWARTWRPDKRQRAMYLSSPARTIVVTGTAGWAELGALAAALRPPG